METLNGTKHESVLLTEREYSGLEYAYDYFNRELFADSLPQLLVTFQRQANTRGLFLRGPFSVTDWRNRHARTRAQLNAFPGRTDEDILSTLVHEMVHHQQHKFGHPSRSGYHNREFADLMRKIGLEASSTGLPGGKSTGQAMTHYILKGGPYQIAYRKLQASSWTLNWESLGDTQRTQASRVQGQVHLLDLRAKRLGKTQRSAQVRRLPRRSRHARTTRCQD